MKCTLFYAPINNFINPWLPGEKFKPIIIRDADGAPRASPPHFLAGKPVAPLSFADSLRERRDSVARHPESDRIHSRLKPCLSAVGVKPFISYFPERLLS
jgi:hypothetical protein